MRAFLLGIAAALLILGIVLVMADRKRGQELTSQATLTPRVWLPFVTCSEGCATPTPHAVKAALNTCCPGTCDMFQQLGAEWYYGWSPQCDDSCAGVPRYAMVRDLAQLEHVKTGAVDISGCGPILGFNEPSNPDCLAGSCMTLAQLVDAWHELEALTIGKQLVGPAFYHHPTLPYDFVDFLDAFHDKYGRYPRMEVAAIHEYGLGDVDIEFESFDRPDYLYVKDALAVRGYDIPIWVTELGWFAIGMSNEEQRADAYLQKWFDFCNVETSCQYLNWFGPTSGGYNVIPLLENGQPTLPGQTWQGEFN